MSSRKKERDGFWKQYFRRFDVIITQRGGRDVERRISLSRFIISLYAAVISAVAIAVTVLLLFYSPLKQLMPGYVSPDARRQMVESVLRIDSLAEAVQRHQLYVINIQDILRGELRVDSVSSIDSITVLRSEDLMERTEREKDFVKRYEENEKYNLTSQNLRKSDMEELHFSAPLRGMLAEAYNPKAQHYGVDVMASTDKTVSVVLDGTVLMDDYTANHGYVVIVQHTGNLVSIYKHLSSVFVHEGAKVKGGEALGIAGVQGNKLEQPWLHFELWHKGTSLDPTQYIPF